jgi:hypothetical protein
MFVAGAILLLSARMCSSWAESLELPLVGGGAAMIVSAPRHQTGVLPLQEGRRDMSGNRVVAAVAALLVGLAGIWLVGVA